MPTDIIRKAVVELSLRLKDDKLTIDTSEAQKALEATRSVAGKLDDQIVKSARLAAAGGENIERVYKEAASVTRQYAEQQAKLTDAHLRATDAAKTAGEGLFTLGRGFALLTSSSEESLKSNLETIAAFQGGFDVFRGGADLVRGAVDAQRALTAATAASAAAETARAGAVAATGAAAAATTPRLLAMNVAMGPLGIAALGITAALTTGVTLWRRWGDEGVDASTRASNAAQGALAQLKRAQSEARLLRDQARLVRGFQSPEAQVASITADLDRIGPIASADSLSGRFEGLLSRRLQLTNQREKLTTQRGPWEDGDPIQLKETESELEAVNTRIKASRPIVVKSLRDEAEEARERQRLLVERAGVRRGVLTDRRTDIDRGIADEERDIDLAKAAIRTAEAQRRQRDLDFLGKGPRAQDLLRRATDEDRLADLSPEELKQLQSLSTTFTSQIESERLFRAGKIDARPETVQDQGAEARAEVAESEATIKNLEEQRMEIEQGLLDLNDTLTRQLGILTEGLKALESRASLLEEEVDKFNFPGEP